MMHENEMTEFKKTTGELSDAMKSVSAILNKHRRGVLYFGMKNDGTPASFSITDSTLRDVSRKIFESIRPQIFPVIDTIKVDGYEVIRVTFEGDDVPYSAGGKYYIRTADEDRELTPGELRRIMIGKEYEENWECRLTDETIDDVSDNVLYDFYRAATRCGRLPEFGLENEADKRHLLEKLGVLIGDNLTNAGRCLFSKNKPVVLKMAVFATDEKVTFLDIVREEGNLFQLIDAAMNYIMKNMRWGVSMGPDGIHRVETPEVPIDAVREAITNSFAHARYDVEVQHEIDVFADRITITNPGDFANPFEPIDYATMNLRSYLRNEVIAKTLYLCQNVEAFGSGIKRIYRLCDEAGVDISYSNSHMAFSFEFFREDRNRQLLCNEKSGIFDDTEHAVARNNAYLQRLNRNWEQAGETSRPLSKTELLILSSLREDPHLTINDLSAKSKKSVRTVNRYLSTLREQGLVERVGSNKTGYWMVK